MKKGHSNLHKRTRGYVSIFPHSVNLLLYYIILYYIILYLLYYTFGKIYLQPRVPPRVLFIKKYKIYTQIKSQNGKKNNNSSEQKYSQRAL